MGRLRRNALYLDPDPKRPGLWLLRGMFLGRQIRRQSHDVGALQDIKDELERQLVPADNKASALRSTWLTEDQLRDAEAAVTRAGPKRLLDCVIAAERVLPSAHPVACADAMTEWLAYLRDRQRYSATLGKNKRRITQFLEHAGQPRHLSDITPRHCEAWIFRGGTRGYTPLTDGRVLAAWLGWCVRRRHLASSPLEVDLRDLAQSSRTIDTPRIATPDQIAALLAAACQLGGGRMVPYVVLTGWCMLRHAEAIRTTPDLLKLDLRQPVVEVRPRKRGTPSYRTVQIPASVLPFLRRAVEAGHFTRTAHIRVGRRRQTVEHRGAYFGKTLWETIRARAGLITLGRAGPSKRRPILESIWQENILRHSGISYLHQHLGDMREVCRQAGNSDETSFRHYLTLPAEGAAARFYSAELVAPSLALYPPPRATPPPS